MHFDSGLLVPFDDRRVLALGVIEEGRRSNIRRAGRD